jgi:hypothetical protein
VLLLITGASGAGKSSVRVAIAPALAPAVECVELMTVVPIPPAPTLAWRQEATETLVRRAIALQQSGRHLLVSGDPVAAGEVVAAPSAPRLDGVAFCLLDVAPEVQSTRLAARGDDPALLPQHHGFAAWMRAHATDPTHMTEVLQTNGWPAMRWERLHQQRATWHTHVIDTTTMTRDAVAATALAWCRTVLPS